MHDTNPRDNAKPFQFRLRQLLLVTLWCAGLFACGTQLGAPVAAFYLMVTVLTLMAWYVHVQETWARLRTVGLVALVLLPIGVVCILPAFQRVRSGGSRTSPCTSNLKQLGIALHAYHQRYGALPPAYVADDNGRPMHSWRVLILPFMDNGPLYKQYRFDEPWDGPNNSKLHNIAVPDFICPSDPQKSGFSTSYVAVVGPQTMWPGTESRQFKDVIDGAADTILLVEVVDSGIHWMEPRDLAFDDFAPAPLTGSTSKLPVSSGHRAGFNVLLGDGSARTIADVFDPTVLRNILTADGGEEIAGLE